MATPTDNEDDVSYTGHKPRPTIYNGITMRSRLEAEFARMLDTRFSGTPWEYEPVAYADAEGTYLPDFVTNAKYFHEIEPANHTNWDETLRKMHVILGSVPDATLAVHRPGEWTGDGYVDWSAARTCTPSRPCGKSYCPRQAAQ